MIKSNSPGPVLAGLLLSLASASAQFADSVLRYQSGALPASLAAYTNGSAALFEPSRVTPGPFGGPVDPFSPPYLPEQVVSIGDGGTLVVQLARPIRNEPGHAFGIDFLIFGNAGLVITNGDFSGGGITDGSLFGPSTGVSRVWVSEDEVRWFELDPARAPTVDAFFPTDGSGDFLRPVNPAFDASALAGLGLAGLRNLYGGSAGGTGFDLAWARDGTGAPVRLGDVHYVRVDMLGGHAEIDGFVVVPEPGVWGLGGLGLAFLVLARRVQVRAASKRETIPGTFRTKVWPTVFEPFARRRIAGRCGTQESASAPRRLPVCGISRHALSTPATLPGFGARTVPVRRAWWEPARWKVPALPVVPSRCGRGPPALRPIGWKCRCSVRSLGAVLAVVLGTVGGRAGGAATFVEDFTVEPGAHGWQERDTAGLFAWNSGSKGLAVTWDSSRSNSFFWHALGTVLGSGDDFSLGFDLRLDDIAHGTNPEKPYAFQLAIGLINSREMTRSNLARGIGVHPELGPRHLIEFDYFPDAGFGATVALTAVSSNNQFRVSHNFPLELTPGAAFRVEMSYTASNRMLRASMTRDGEPFGLPPDQSLDPVSLAGMSGFRVDALAVCSYSDERADGSLLAHGEVDNITWTVPAPPVTALRGRAADGVWRVEFTSRTDWIYTLERTTDFREWSGPGPGQAGSGGVMTLTDAMAAAGPASFYRVRAERPGGAE